MTPELSEDMRAALHARQGDDLQLVDPQTHRVYVLVDFEKHVKAMQALREQSDWKSVERGLIQARRGDGMSLNAARRTLRRELRFPETA